MQRNAMFGIPVIIVSDNVLICFFTRQYRRKHQAIIVYPWLCIENGDVIGIRIFVQKVFQHAPWCHAVTYDDEFLFVSHSAASTILEPE